MLGKDSFNQQDPKEVLGQTDEVLQEKKSKLMTKESQAVVEDIQAIIGDTKKIIDTRGTILQSLIDHATKAVESTKSMAPSDSDVSAEIQQASETFVKDLAAAAEALKRLLKIFVTSTTFRQLLVNINSTIRDSLLGISEQVEETLLDEQKAKRLVSEPPITGSASGSQTIKVDSEVEEKAHLSGDVHGVSEELLQQASKKLHHIEKPVESHEPIVTETPNIKEAFKGITQLSEESRQELLKRWHQLLQELASNAQYRDAVTDLLVILQSVYHHFFELSNYLALKSEEKKPELRKGLMEWVAALQDARELLESFAKKSMQPLLNDVKLWSEQVRNDKELIVILRLAKVFIIDCLENPNALQEEAFKSRAGKLLDKLNKKLLTTYRDLTQQTIQDTSDFFLSLGQDEETQALVTDTKQLARDLFLDEKGQLVLKPEIIEEIRDNLIPLLLERLNKVKLPRVEESTDSLDYVIDDMVLDIPEVLPENIDIKNFTGISVNRDLSNLVSTLQVRISGVRTDIEDGKFYYKRKTFPKLEDSGTLDLHIKGQGVTIQFILNFDPARTQRGHTFHSAQVGSGIDQLDLELHGSHDLLYKMLHPFINSTVKKIVEEKIVEALKDVVVNLDVQVTRAREQLAKQSSIILDKGATTLEPVIQGAKNLSLAASDSNA